MPVPDYQTIMLPLLSLLRDGGVHEVREVRDRLTEHFELSEEDLRETLPSGPTPLFNNRVGWATTYLKQARLIDSPKRGTYRLTSRGAEVLQQGPSSIGRDFLAQFPEFKEFLSRSSDGSTTQPQAATIIQPATAIVQAAHEGTPEEVLEGAYRNLRSEVEAELLQQIRDASPAFFERLVVDLLVGMGYGGSQRDAGRAIGQTGDGGIDGIVKEDRLGLDVIYIQAKRWQNTVGRPDVQAFAGSLEGARARKGVFITTSSFSKDAHEYVRRIDKKIVLIDGLQLAALMFDFGIGVSRVASFEVKRVDGDYFIEG